MKFLYIKSKFRHIKNLSPLQALTKQLARQFFVLFKRRSAFELIKGKILNNFSHTAREHVDFNESICNAGLVRTIDGYICVAKNQKFSFCHEINGNKFRQPENNNTDDGIRLLYRIDFDVNWRVKSIQKLRVVLDGQTVDPVIFIEDVRLMLHERKIMAFANGNGAWPLLGILDKDTIFLRRSVADFSAPQKNWMPFSYENCIFLEHSIAPHLILKLDPNNAECIKEFCTTAAISSVQFTLHGGAPSLRISNDYFLGVGNSQHLYWFQERYYAAVFYMFEAKPPFRVVKISRPTRIQSRSYRIQYISGMAFSDDKKNLILSIGVCDCDNLIIMISLHETLALLQDYI